MKLAASLTLLALAGSVLLPRAAPAAPARHALVIGNGTYGSLPTLPACLQSAHAVAAALRGLGFQVVEREDLSSGGIDAAIGEFSGQLAAAPGSAAFIYSCGYAIAFNDRPFMLPVSARISRAPDVLTQGVLAKTLIDAVTRGGAAASIIAMDIVPAPDAPAALGFESLIQANLPEGLGLLAVSQPKPPDTPTPLATALIAGLKGPEVRTNTLLVALQQQLGAGKPVTVAAVHTPATAGFLAGAPPPPPPPPVAATPPPPAPAPPPQVAAVTPVQPPSVTMPDEELMSPADRRSVQSALGRLGYYPGPIDGLFGPDTRAAIRRYQHELGAEMTGRLSGSQAGRLVSGR